MRLLVITSTLIALAGAAPAEAPAAATIPVPAAPISGPVLAQDGEALWASPRADYGFDLLDALRVSPARTVRRFSSYTSADGHDVALSPLLAAAGGQIGLAIDAEPIPFSRYEYELEPADADVLGGTADGPLEPLLHCRPGLPVAVTVAVAEHGTVLPGPDCDAARSGGLALRGEDGQLKPLTPSGTQARAAGSFVGWIGRNGEIVVYDTSSASVAYTIAMSPVERVADWDLQDDGKVALARAPDGDQPATLAWYSPAEPARHELGLPLAQAWDVHIAGDRIVFLRTHEPYRGPGYYFGDLQVIGLDGGPARTFSNRAIGIEQNHSLIGFDGTTIAWTTPACSGALLHRKPVDKPPPGLDDGPRPRCRLGFRSRPKLLDERSIRVPLRCSGFVLPQCGGSVVRLDAVRQHVKLGSDESRFCNAVADVFLTRRGRALVRKHRKLRVRVTATTTDTGGQREIRRAEFTLRRGERARSNTCEDDI